MVSTLTYGISGAVRAVESRDFIHTFPMTTVRLARNQDYAPETSFKACCTSAKEVVMSQMLNERSKCSMWTMLA